MKKTLKNLAPEGLLEKILYKVSVQRQTQKLKQRLGLVSFALIFQIAFFRFIFEDLFTGLYQTNFFNFFRLIFSDSQIFLQNWKESSLYLLESVPAGEIGLSLILIFGFFLTFQFLTKNLNQFFKNWKILTKENPL